MTADGRGTERRQVNRGGPGDAERRGLADRRAENNLLCLHFNVGDTAFLVDVRDVQEIMAMPAIAPVPLAPAAVVGLVNLRGQILTAVDLRTLMGEAPRCGAPVGVVMRCAGESLALMVDEVHDVLEVSPTMLRPTPPNFGGPGRGMVAGVCQWPDLLLLVLDPAGIAPLLLPAGSEAAIV